jgi:hypothetical protein
MGMLNNRNGKMPLLLRSIHLVATIFTLTIIFASTTTLVSASTTGNTTTTTTNTTSIGGEEQEAASSSMNTITNNNVSNAVLGNLFQIVEFETSTINPINETYIEISSENKVTIIPPNVTAGTTINATETTNATANILPNGLSVSKGQSLLVTEGDDDSAAEQENATSTFVQITRFNPDGTAVGTGVAFFSTNSTGQLAFLNNMVGIMQSEFSSEGGSIRTWEWKGGMLPFESGGDGAPTMGEQEAASSTNTTTTTTNNVSNAPLGNLFSFGEESTEVNVNPINETYIVVSYSGGNRIIMPPNATGVINSTETGNLTINIQPNGLSINQGQAVIMTEEGAAAAEENATITFILLSRTNPDGSGSGTGVTFFSTNSTGQLAFLDNMVAIGQIEYSPEEGINRFREWEWKGGMLPFESGGDGAPTMGGTRLPSSHQDARGTRIKAVAVIAFTASLPPAWTGWDLNKLLFMQS